MSSKVIILSIFVFANLINPAHSVESLGYKPGELIVRFAPRANEVQISIAERNTILASLGGGEVKHTYKLVPGLSLVKLTEGVSVKDAVAKFNKAEGILYAEPNYKIRLFSAFPNDLKFNELWGMHNAGQLHSMESGYNSSGTPDADINAPETWGIATDSNIIVAVIDTGVDYTHPDLVANMWVNPGEIPGNGLDDDGNGYVDDIYGYDFSTWGDKDRDSDPMDDYDHGTHCAGTIGAVGNNEDGVVGICWNVKIMALKFMTYGCEPGYGCGCYGWTSDAIDSIEYAVEMGARVLNNSWGLPNSLGLKNAIEASDANGVLFVAAAGNAQFANNNDTNPIYPASYDCNNIISVLWTDDNDKKSSFSNYGATSVDLGAPGSDILSCVPGGGYQYMNGTSMATPHVAGACALVWSVNPLLSHLEVKDIILDTVDKKTALSGRCLTGGRLNLYKAVLEATKRQQLLRIDDTNNPVNLYDEITYTIHYFNPPVGDPNYIGTLTGVSIIDCPPEEVYFISASGPNAYDIFTNTVTWNIGTLGPNESGSVTLTMQVNELAEPLGNITNICVLDANEIKPITAVEITDVNARNPGIIYVDVNAIGSNTGMLWSKAYRYLQDALDRAGAGCGSEIWVAEGTYRPSKWTNPNDSQTATFQLINGAPIYGGFPSAGGIRNCLENQTILDGYLGGNGYDVNYVVLAQNVNEATILDGFIIKNGHSRGIYCSNANPNIINCNIGPDNYTGIYCFNSDPNIINCNIEHNNYGYGIECENSSPNIINCRIEHNGHEPPVGYSGICCHNHSNPNIISCVIADNGCYDNYLGGGIYCFYYCSPTITNCILRDNKAQMGGGIYNNLSSPTITNCILGGNQAYYGGGIYNGSYSSPTVKNCILWGNYPYQIYKSGSSSPSVSYCDIQGGWSGTGNINKDPCFYNPGDPNSYHLTANSPCIDKGSNSAVPAYILTDIDGENRKIDGDRNTSIIVDMGADEYYWSRADFNLDEIVNFIDYAMFANAWHTSSGGPGYNDIYDLENNNSIDYKDLALFCKDWLWIAGWNQTLGSMMMGQGMGEGMSQSMDQSLSLMDESYLSDQAEQQPEQVTQLDIEEMLKQLEELWLDPDAREVIDEDSWLAFVESVKSELE